MYCKDLSAYRYAEHLKRRGLRNVGWLSGRKPYAQGRVSDAAKDALWAHLLLPVARMRGFHECDLCAPSPKGPLSASHNGATLTLGWAEIRVFANSGRVYAAPTLVWHYVEAHSYAPPDEFVAALLDGVAPGSPAFIERVCEYDSGFVHPAALTKRPGR
ncbi:MAG: hypothetical protein JNK05_01405 [Myxococcales bacterium]|nr:hypothetical protein [Myxococcales bacterium]